MEGACRDMRILQIGNFFPPRYAGGAEVAAFHGAWGLRRQGVDVRVLSSCARYPQAFDNAYEYHGLKVHEIGWPPPRSRWGQLVNLRVYRAVLREIDVLRPDLIHLHNLSGCSLAPYLAARRRRVPVIQTLHDHWLLCPSNILYKTDAGRCESASAWRSCGGCLRRYDYWGAVPWRRAVMRALTRSARCFISPSHRLIALHVAAGYDRARFRHLPYGFDFSRFHDVEGGTDSAIPDSAGKNIILFSGALVETKGLDVLLRAIPLLSRYIDGLELWVLGGGEARYTDHLRDYATAGVRLLGHVPFQRAAALYSRAALTVVPSVWFDNSPVVVYESFASGTPVLGSAIGGITELIGEGVTGYVVPPGDAAALAERAILHFAKPQRERDEMRAACRSYFASRLTLDRYAKGFLDIVAGGLANNHSPLDPAAALERKGGR